MTITDERDLEALRRIGQIVARAMRAMAAALRPGITTRELDAIGAEFLTRHGAVSAPISVYNFPGATCISVNEEAAHGIPGDRVINAGDMVNIDVSAALDGYFADTGATFLVPPSTTTQERLCQCAKAALQAGIDAAKPGRRIRDVGRAIEMQARRCGFRVIENLAGHGIGRSLHEEPESISAFDDRSDTRRFREGQVITIEPFLTTGARLAVEKGDGWTLLTEDGGMVAQYEHTLVITRDQPIILTVP
ncbi:MAG: type I methionyl aminopeptidase [Dehalococcoidia bacterium]|nr:type I methionyl aminopeptidase [Dehalococcoidia bacterium]